MCYFLLIHYLKLANMFGWVFFSRLFLMRISDIPYLDLAGDDGMSKKNETHLKYLYTLISFDMYMYIVRILPLFFFPLCSSSKQGSCVSCHISKGMESTRSLSALLSLW